MQTYYYKAINWNAAIEDVIVMGVLPGEKLTEYPGWYADSPSTDLDDWRKLSHGEKDLAKVFGRPDPAGYFQSESGVDALRKDVRTAYEEAVFNNIQSITCSRQVLLFIFSRSTLSQKSMKSCLTNTNSYPQKKAEIINEIHLNGTALEKKITSVFWKPSSTFGSFTCLLSGE